VQGGPSTASKCFSAGPEVKSTESLRVDSLRKGRRYHVRVKSSTPQPARKRADLLAQGQRVIRFSRRCQLFPREKGLVFDFGVVDPTQALPVAGLPMRPGRGTKYESLLKTLESAALGEHALSRRSRESIAAMSPIGSELLDALDGKNSAFAAAGSWQALARSYDETLLEPCFRAPLRYLIQVQETVIRIVPLAREGRREKIEQLAREAYSCDPVVVWRDVLPSSALAAALPLHSALTALAVLEMHRKQEQSVVLRLLAPNHRPMAHWCASVCSAYRVDTLDALAGRAARLRKDQLTSSGVSLSHGLLRQWSSGRQLPHRANRDALLSGLPEEEAAHLRTCHAIARFLTFLVDVVAAYSEPAISWGEAQGAVRVRYSDVYRTRGGTV